MDRGTHQPVGSLLCCSYEFPPLGGGGSRVVEGLTRQLSDLGLGIDIVTMGAARLPAFEQMGSIRLHRISGIRRRPEICHPHEMAWHLIRAQAYVHRLVGRTRFDVNHTHFIFPDGLLAWRLKQVTGLRYIVTAHGSDVPGYNPDRFVGLHRLAAPVWRRVVGAADAIVCPSRHLERLVLARAPIARTVVIPNGIDVDRFAMNRPRQPAMLVVARLVDRKGVQHLLEALHERAYPWTVHIVGDGPARAKLEVLARASRTPTRFWGWLDNGSTQLRDLFETSRIFVYPSSDENFPVALLEAMAAGLAIVTTRGTGCAEVVADTALLVGAADPGEIRGALDRLTSDPDLCRSLSAAARARVDQLFSWHAVAARYQRVLAAAGRP
ncbi:MAG: glycosyltransferase family 4 protein [Geminicoccaceae bacterium]